MRIFFVVKIRKDTSFGQKFHWIGSKVIFVNGSLEVTQPFVSMDIKSSNPF